MSHLPNVLPEVRGTRLCLAETRGKKSRSFLRPPIQSYVFVWARMHARSSLTREHAQETQSKGLDTVLASNYTVLSQGSLLLLAPSGIEMLFIG
jgi:hypothetical protein